jgi:hypothetical protein
MYLQLGLKLPCRLTAREAAAVDEWLQSDLSFHVMR